MQAPRLLALALAEPLFSPGKKPRPLVVGRIRQRALLLSTLSSTMRTTSPECPIGRYERSASNSMPTPYAGPSADDASVGASSPWRDVVAVPFDPSELKSRRGTPCGRRRAHDSGIG